MKSRNGASRLFATLVQEAGLRLHPRAKVPLGGAHLAAGQHKARRPIRQLLMAALWPMRAGREKQQQQQQQQCLRPPPGERLFELFEFFLLFAFV